MKIFYSKSEFLKNLFPGIDLNDNNAVEVEIKKYFKSIGFDGIINIDEDIISVGIDLELDQDYPKEFYQATNLCAKGKFAEARPILAKLIDEHPMVSEYYRNLAQSYEEDQQSEKARDILIDALRIDPNSESALVLMGNIYSRYYDDIETAMTYYDQVVKANPANYIALNNIGGAFLQSDKPNYALRYFEKALRINSNYPNTSYGMAMSYKLTGRPLKSFEFSIKSLKLSEVKSSPLYKASVNLALESAQAAFKENDGAEDVTDFIKEIEALTGKEVRIEEDNSIPTIATVQIAENHNRDYHLIKFKKSPEVNHLIIHELIHILFYNNARKINENKLFIVHMDKKAAFKVRNAKEISRLINKGYPKDQIYGFMDQLFEGLLRQVFNTPIDLFIEDFIYKKFPKLRPVQFISLFKMSNENLNAVTDTKALELVPDVIMSQSKIYNMVLAKQFEDLFGIKRLEEYLPKHRDLEIYEKFWSEFIEYRDDWEPSEEYELVENWGKDLSLNEYFSLVDENEHRAKQGGGKRKSSIDDLLPESPFESDLNQDEEEELEEFKKNHSNKDLNLAVAFYMIGAMDFYSKLPNNKVKDIAAEIALLGSTGIDPKKDGYKVSAIPNETFSGYRLLAYYYVGFSIGFPEYLDQLGMPFEQEFEFASNFKK